MNEAVDLTSSLPVETATLDIVKPGTKEKTGWAISLAGPSHPKTVAFNEAQRRKRDDRERRIEMAQVNGRKWKGDDDEVDSRREFVRGLVARIVDWTPVRIGDTTYSFSEEAAVELLLRPEMGNFVYQIAERLSEDDAFTKGSAKT